MTDLLVALWCVFSLVCLVGMTCNEIGRVWLRRAKANLDLGWQACDTKVVEHCLTRAIVWGNRSSWLLNAITLGLADAPVEPPPPPAAGTGAA